MLTGMRRHEDDARDSSRQHRQADLLGRLPGRLEGVYLFSSRKRDVLQDHDGVVDTTPTISTGEHVTR